MSLKYGIIFAGLAVLAAFLIPPMIPPAFEIRSASPHPSKTMAAVVYREHGDPSVLQPDDQHPQPMPKGNQYLIQVKASALNPVDFKQRRNSLIPHFVVPLPKIPGGDIAGVVVQVPKNSKNPNNNPKFQVGDTVAALMPYIGSRWGALADFVAVEERFLARFDAAKVDFTAAASYALAGLTVVQHFANLNVPKEEEEPFFKGKKLLVHAGAGGVGTFAIQWGKLLGMYVATTASAPKADFLKDLGADQVIDYRTTNFEDVLSDFDVVLDPMSWLYEERSLKVLKPSGHYLNIPSSDWGFDDGVEKTNGASTAMNFVSSKIRNLFQPGKTPKYGLVAVDPNGEQLQQILDYMESGKIRPVIDRSYHFSEAADAFRYLEGGHVTGKVVLYHGELPHEEKEVVGD